MTALPASVVTARELVDPVLRKAVDRLDRDTRRVVGYHFGWTDVSGAPAGSPGKAIRPALTLAAARAGGGNPDAAVAGAAAVELVHNFSLLHDDLMDGDTERRHRPTAWRVFGRSAAVLAGDGLLALAGELVLEDASPAAAAAARTLFAATGALVAGQAADLDFENRMDVTLGECLRMVTAKTGALLSCATRIGAQLVLAPPTVVDGLAVFGAELGVAFQLVDDLLGLWGDPQRTGKPVLSDLRTRKKSVPIVHALTSGTSHGRRLAELYRQPGTLTEQELREAAECVVAAGSRDWVREECERRLGAAERRLRSVVTDGAAADMLIELGGFIVRRQL